MFNEDEVRGKAVVGYLRESDPNAQDGNSLAKQRNLYNEFCVNHGCKRLEPVEDQAAGGSNRENLNNLIADIRSGKIQADYLWIYEFSRLTREGLDSLAKYQPLFETIPIILDNGQAGVEIRDYTNGLDLISFIRLGCDFSMPEEEVKRLSGRVASTMLNDAKAGNLPPARTYGYKNVYPSQTEKSRKIEEWRTEQIPSQAKIVKEIFERFANGEGVTTIVRDLNRRGIETPSKARNIKGKTSEKWNNRSVAKILDNPIMVGRYTYGKRSYGKYTRIQNGKIREVPLKERRSWNKSPKEQMNADYIDEPNSSIDAIISESLWNRVQKLRNKTKSESAKHRKTKGNSRHVFASKLKCGHCNFTLTGRRQTTKVKYFCDGTFKERCPKPHRHISESEVLNYIGQALDVILSDTNCQKLLIQGTIDYYETMKASYDSDEEVTIENDIARIDEKIARYNSTIEVMTEEGAPLDSIKAITAKLKSLKEEKENLEEEHSKVTAVKREAISLQKSLKNWWKRRKEEISNDVKNSARNAVNQVVSGLLETAPLEERILMTEHANNAAFPVSREAAYISGLVNQSKLQEGQTIEDIVKERFANFENPIGIDNEEIGRHKQEINGKEVSFPVSLKNAKLDLDESVRRRNIAQQIIDTITITWGEPYEYQGGKEKVDVAEVRIRFKTPVLDIDRAFPITTEDLGNESSITPAHFLALSLISLRCQLPCQRISFTAAYARSLASEMS